MTKKIFLASLFLLLSVPAWAVQEIDLDLPSAPTYTLVPTEAPTEVPTPLPADTPVPEATAAPTSTPTAAPELMEIEKEEPTPIPTPRKVSKKKALEEPDMEPYPTDQLYFLGKFGFLAPDNPPTHGWLERGVDQQKKFFEMNDKIVLQFNPARKVKPGHFFIYYREAGLLKDAASKVHGVMVRPMAIGVVDEVKKSAVVGKLTYSFLGLYPNDKFLMLNSWRQSLGSAAETKVETKGILVTEQNSKKAIVAGDAVYLNLGSSEGVKAGNLFHVMKEDALQGTPSNPFIAIAGVRVLAVLPHSCVAMVNWINETVLPGSPIEKAVVPEYVPKAPSAPATGTQPAATPAAAVEEKK